MVEYEGVLANCAIAGNQSLHDEFDGSGVLLLDGGTIESCTAADNYSAATNGCAVRAEVDEEEGGGATSCGEMRNSIVWGNSNANYAPADVAAATLDLVEYSCAPELTAGVNGNQNGDPQFVDAAGGDYRLAEGSPCIDAGANQGWMAGALDLGGGERIVDGTVDMGAFEFQGAELSVSPTNVAVGADAGSTTFAVSNEGEGTMAYAAATADGWLAITNGATGTNAGTVAVAYGANPLTTARTGTVTVAAAGARNSPATVEVVQEGAAAALEIEPAATNVAAAGGTGLEIAVEANVDWEASVGTGAEWLSIAAGTNAGNGTVEYNAASNGQAAARTGTIVVAGGGISGTCTVVQAGAAVSGWDAGYTDLGGGWRRLGWFGDYATMALEGWIWHNKHGFFYVADTSTPGDVWLYAMDMGWLYTGNTLYPFLYRANDGAWIWYNGSTNPRWFMNFTSGQWESRP